MQVRALQSGSKQVAWHRRKSTQELLGKILLLLLIVTGAVLASIPFLWMLSTSLKTDSEVYYYPPRWIPPILAWRNYIEALVAIPYWRYLINTSIITFTSMAGALLSSSLVAFGFARLRAPGKDLLFVILLSTMMLPAQVTLVPVYLLFKFLGWVDTFLPLIVPSLFGGGPFFIFLLRQFYMTLPLELDDAARIDGCGFFGIYLRLILPLSKPALATVAIFSFMHHWNDFFGPLVYLNSMEKYTISLGLTFFQSIYGVVKWNWLMAASVVTLLPCLVLFFVAQRYFIQGIVVTGLKG